MDRESNYVAVGAFVLLVILLAAGFVLWYSDAADGQEQARYESYFEGSVSGLSEGSSVRYLGVVVGRVAHIGIDPRDAARVRVVMDINEDAPISANTAARLTLQGVTGLVADAGVAEGVDAHAAALPRAYAMASASASRTGDWGSPSSRTALDPSTHIRLRAISAPSSGASGSRPSSRPSTASSTAAAAIARACGMRTRGARRPLSAASVWRIWRSVMFWLPRM